MTRFATICMPLLLLVGCGQITLPQKEPKKEERVFTRQEFYDAVYEKSPEQVVELLGKPHSTEDNRLSGGYKLVYTYKYRSYDPVAEKLDSITTIDFRRFDDNKNEVRAEIIKFLP